MGFDTGVLGPWICDRSSRGHPGMGTRVSIHRTACLSDLVRQRPLSASRGETRCDTYRNRHPCTFGAEDSRLETSARCLRSVVMLRQSSTAAAAVLVGLA